MPTSSALAVRSACGDLLAAVPQTLGEGLDRRPVAGDPSRTAAWGDPAITLTCGVAAAPPSAEPVEIGGATGGTLAFDVSDSGAGNRWTTRDRAVPVQMDVPDDYDAQPLLRLVPVIKQAVPAR